MCCCCFLFSMQCFNTSFRPFYLLRFTKYHFKAVTTNSWMPPTTNRPIKHCVWCHLLTSWTRSYSMCFFLLKLNKASRLLCNKVRFYHIPSWAEDRSLQRHIKYAHLVRRLSKYSLIWPEINKMQIPQSASNQSIKCNISWVQDLNSYGYVINNSNSSRPYSCSILIEK